MKVVVLGGGTVGSSVAELLCQQRHSVVVVDSDPATVRRINERLDVRGLTGCASQSSILFQAGVLDADLCLAVTGFDEVNLVAGSIAKSMGSRRAVARVYGPVFHDLSTFDYQRHFNLDRIVSLEHLSAVALSRGIRTPEAVAAESVARGEIEVQEIDVSDKARACGKQLKELELPKGIRVGSIFRQGKLKIAVADDRMEAGDRITLIGAREVIDNVKGEFQHRAPPMQDVVVAGGGETGYHLAQLLDNGRFRVLVMETNMERCEFLSAHLKNATVVHCDATRRISLEEERVGKADVFVACTGDDEDNIMSGVEARELGAKTILAVVNRPDYANVVGKLGIDHAVSPRQVMARQILGFLTTGPVVARTSLPGGGIVMLEIEVVAGAPATEHVLANLKLPRDCLIAAMMRGEYARVPNADDRLQEGDTLVALVAETAIDEMLPLFHANGRAG